MDHYCDTQPPRCIIKYDYLVLPKYIPICCCINISNPDWLLYIYLEVLISINQLISHFGVTYFKYRQSMHKNE